jgi:hypothetical protein
VDAETLITGHNQPVEQRGFLIIRSALTEWYDPVSRRGHFPRHLGVDGFFRFEQRRSKATKEQQTGGQKKEKKGDELRPLPPSPLGGEGTGVRGRQLQQP